jgi:hypothetical protein
VFGESVEIGRQTAFWSPLSPAMTPQFAEKCWNRQFQAISEHFLFDCEFEARKIAAMRKVTA